ncbi:hypothetical protein F5B22DRAFT_624842 [Xylaria bambusicola]|uniref:uncharacterized protein n=1 Tax=Xylaria bambusicola TaxID=326684 RepID=UPI0020081672|nr:uncharacterized protein F5B22DRAFT_624842 [Xylaria bambusicola]KAI0506250.1 hypothetical protein F5B22DRAFT_624842 [Xylaria bambusicola]
MEMSHRQSCDRCRQQKVRCRRDESQRWSNNASSAEQGPPSRCERCTKAAVECVYSLKQRSKSRISHHHHQASITSQAGRHTDLRPRSNSSWVEQGIRGPSYPGGPLMSPDMSVGDALGQFPFDESDIFHSWDADLQGFASSSLNSLLAPSASDAALVMPISTAPSSHGEEDDSEYEDEEDVSDSPFSQLIALSDRVTRSMRCLARPGRAPLTASSPEINGALEDTNILIRIISGLTASRACEDSQNYGLVFSALACHQHLMALFRVICDVIHRSVQAKREQQKQQHGSRTDMGPSSVAQFVMVLQLLTHLINRMDRSLFRGGPVVARGSVGGYVTPTTPDGGDNHTVTFGTSMDCERSSSPDGLLVRVHEIVGKIPSEHDKLRQAIRKLQTDMEHPELH